MAETKTTQITSLDASPPAVLPAPEIGARIRPYGMDHVQSGAGAAADTIVLARLTGRFRIFLPLCYLKYSAGGGTAALSIGWRAYTGLDGVAVAESAGGLVNALSIVAAGDVIGADWCGVLTEGYKDFAARDEVELFATITGSGLPDAHTIKGFMAYSHN